VSTDMLRRRTNWRVIIIIIIY